MLFSWLTFSTTVIFALAVPRPTPDAAPLEPDGSITDIPEVVAVVENVLNEPSSIFSLVTPERLKVAHNIRPEVNDLVISKTVNVVQPERFNVAHNVRPEEGNIPVNKSVIEEDAVENVVAGLNLLNVGRLNSLSQQENTQIKLNSSTSSSHFEEVLKTLSATSNTSYDAHLEKPVEQLIPNRSEEVISKNEQLREHQEPNKPEVIVIHDGFIVDSSDVANAKTEHLAAHAEQVSIHEDLHRAAIKSEEARNKDEYLAELDRKIGVLKGVVKSKDEIVRKPEVALKGDEFIEDTVDVAKYLSDHLAAQAELVAIHNAALKFNEALQTKQKLDGVANVQVTAQGYIQDSNDVAVAKKQHLALHAEQVAFHNAAVRAANAIEHNVISSFTTLNEHPNISDSSITVSEKASELGEQILNDNLKQSPKSNNSENTDGVLNIIPGNLGIVISFDTQQAESDYENLSSENPSKENQTQSISVSHEDLVYPNVNIEINLNEKYLKIFPTYKELIKTNANSINIEHVDTQTTQKADCNCDQKTKEEDPIVYITKPVSVSEFPQGGLLSNQEKNYFEIADFLHYHKYGSSGNEKSKDNLKFFTP